ncbi:S8 family serine peptidase [Candidatus Sumerlaeota bacterium]|nr:S8 family serine peptidase [Candidatus Sumerlaeota bacterium]
MPDSQPPSGNLLKSAGLKKIAFIPRETFLVSVENPETAKNFLFRSSIALALKPEWKISRCLWKIPCEDSEDDISLVIYSVQSTDELKDKVESAGGVITNIPLTPGKNRLGVRISLSRLSTFLKSVALHPSVYSIQPGFGARILNDNSSQIVQSGNPPTGRPVWDKGIHGEGQIVAVLDTGLDFDSCFFSEDNASSPPLFLGTEKTGEPDNLRRKAIIYDLLYEGDFEADVGDFDNHGHGTSVCGTVAGSKRDDPFGGSVRNGIAPGAQLIVQDGGFIGYDDCSDLAALGCPVVDLTPFLDQAISQGAHIHNDSWGDRENYIPHNLYTGPTADMDESIWRNPEFLIVCAAGNEGGGGIPDTVSSPSTGKNVISAGATSSPSFGGSADDVTMFSSRGWAADGRIKPDIMAPGQVYTAASDKNIYTGNCHLTTIQGTSFSSPAIAGCAALVRQYFTEGWHPTGLKNASDGFIPSAALIKAALLNGTVDMTGNPGAPPNRGEGWGRARLENSLYFDGDARRIMVSDKRDFFTTGTQSDYSIIFKANGNAAAGRLKITLVWTDFPASPAADVSLVNDLDLSVRKIYFPEETYLGNNIDNSSGMPGYSVTGGEADRINNVEMAILAPDTKGAFEARVKPTLIVEPPQGFALVIGGDVSEYTLPQTKGMSLY